MRTHTHSFTCENINTARTHTNKCWWLHIRDAQPIVTVSERIYAHANAYESETKALEVLSLIRTCIQTAVEIESEKLL